MKIWYFLTKTILQFRYWLIEKLAGDMPVVLNMVITRPRGYEGGLAYFPRKDLPGIFEYNRLLFQEAPNAILIPKRDFEANSGGVKNGGVRE